MYIYVCMYACTIRVLMSHPIHRERWDPQLYHCCPSSSSSSSSVLWWRSSLRLTPLSEVRELVFLWATTATWALLKWGLTLVGDYSVTLTWPHAVAVDRVMTVETGSSPMGVCCNLKIVVMIYINPIPRLISKFTFIVVIWELQMEYIGVLLRLKHSMMILVEELSMWDCISVEVRYIIKQVP